MDVYFDIKDTLDKCIKDMDSTNKVHWAYIQQCLASIKRVEEENSQLRQQLDDCDHQISFVVDFFKWQGKQSRFKIVVWNLFGVDIYKKFLKQL